MAEINLVTVIPYPPGGGEWNGQDGVVTLYFFTCEWTPTRLRARAQIFRPTVLLPTLPESRSRKRRMRGRVALGGWGVENSSFN